MYRKEPNYRKYLYRIGSIGSKKAKILMNSLDSAFLDWPAYSSSEAQLAHLKPLLKSETVSHLIFSETVLTMVGI